MVLSIKNNILLSFLLISTLLQTFVKAATSTCNPLFTTNCPPDKALATGFIEDFTKQSDSKWFSRVSSSQGKVTFDSTNGLGLILAKRGDNPSYDSNFYIMYGKVQVLMQTAPGVGIVSSFFLQSDDGDEIDLEWLGGDTTQFQSNYFSKGNVTTYDRGEFHGVQTPAQMFHNYTIDWSMEQTTWSLDGTVVRTLLNTTSQGYPQTPMSIKFGIWAGGDPSNAPGTIEWAGGITDYSAGPFTMYVKQIIVTDYSTGESYSYDGTSGSWESIVAKDGKVNGRYSEAQTEFNELAAGVSLSYSSSSSSSTASSSTASSSTASSSSSSSTSLSSSTVSQTHISSSVSSSTSSSASSTSSLSHTSSTVSRTHGSSSILSSLLTSSSSKPSSSTTKSINPPHETIATTLSSSSPSSKDTTQKTSPTTTASSKSVSTSKELSYTVSTHSGNIGSNLSSPIFNVCLLILSFFMH
ncbi:transglycosylase PWA37_003079 [Arxiozyma heterogenica]|uniref:transglycosylase n=1 Tax=Arxiozyma heterogenica TaxID=278026 RepID=UPI002EDC35A4